MKLNAPQDGSGRWSETNHDDAFIHKYWDDTTVAFGIACCPPGNSSSFAWGLDSEGTMSTGACNDTFLGCFKRYSVAHGTAMGGGTGKIGRANRG